MCAHAIHLSARQAEASLKEKEKKKNHFNGRETTTVKTIALSFALLEGGSVVEVGGGGGGIREFQATTLLLDAILEGCTSCLSKRVNGASCFNFSFEKKTRIFSSKMYIHLYSTPRVLFCPFFPMVRSRMGLPPLRSRLFLARSK